MERNKYVILSLELHLFFARIMEEHSLFLEAGFTPQGAGLAKEAEAFKVRFQNLLTGVVRLSDRVVSADALNSGEIVTEFTMNAERQTQRLTGIAINQQITAAELRLRSGNNSNVNPTLVTEVKRLNRLSVNLLNGLINLKERILNGVNTCNLFTVNYPLLIEHILREAKLYRTYILNIENGKDLECQDMRQIESFWNRIMMEHALFIRGLLDPTEDDLIQASDDFAGEYARLLKKSNEMNNKAITCSTEDALEETIKFRDFKRAGTEGIQNCKIKSIILPLLADHVLREANHYIRLLN